MQESGEICTHITEAKLQGATITLPTLIYNYTVQFIISDIK